MTNPNQRNKSLGFLTGLIAGGAVAAGATFLYQTKKGKKIKRQAEKHLKGIVKDIKQKAIKLEKSLESSNFTLEKKTKKVKRQTKSRAISLRKKFFHRSGKILNN